MILKPADPSIKSHVSGYQRSRFWITAGLSILLAAVFFVLGYLVHEVAGPETARFPLARQAFQILRDHTSLTMPAFKTIQYGMIRGMLATLNDPYTIFNEPAQAELQSNQLEGKFGGIGVRIERDEQNQVLIYPLPDSPALAAGLLDGDVLLSAEGLEITDSTTLDEIQAAIRGPVGQRVSLRIARGDGLEEKTIAVVREEVPIPSVTYNLASFDASIGIIQLNVVADTSPAEISAAIETLKEQGAAKFILDLRNNNGGIVPAGAEVARLFLPEGDFLIEQFRGEAAQTFTNEQAGTFHGLPLAVIVNQATASSAEIIAGALKESGGIKLVGSQTFGKDLIQQVFDLQDGSSLHITAGRWWLPGQPDGIGGVGLTPDVPLSDEATNSVDALIAAAGLLDGR